MKITVLFENTTIDPNLKYGHGLSLYIEANGKRILFDMGQDDSFITNAKTLGTDISKTDFAIISHGHYDHGGGLVPFIDTYKDIPIYINKNAFLSFYSGYEKYIGLYTKLDKSRFILTDSHTSLGNGIMLVTLKNEDIVHPMQNNGMLIKDDEVFKHDYFEHEHYLVITENGKRTVISGCSHRGISNITHKLRPDCVIGGFHFSKLDPSDPMIQNTAKHLLSTNCMFYTCHCTGIEQFNAMKLTMNDKLRYASTGSVICI